MKFTERLKYNLIAGAIIAAIAIAVSAFAASPNDRTAKVQRTGAVFVFVECYPTDEFDVVGSESIGITMSGKYSEIKEKLLKKAAKDFPTADGIIIASPDEGKATVIKFKQ